MSKDQNQSAAAPQAPAAAADHVAAFWASVEDGTVFDDISPETWHLVDKLVEQLKAAGDTAFFDEAPTPAAAVAPAEAAHKAAVDHAHEILGRLLYLRDGDYFVNVNRAGAEAMHVSTVSTIVHAALIGAAAPTQEAEDAARYRILRRGQHWSVVNGVGDTLRADDLDADIDAARARQEGGGAA